MTKAAVVNSGKISNSVTPSTTCCASRATLDNQMRPIRLASVRLVPPKQQQPWPSYTESN